MLENTGLYQKTGKNGLDYELSVNKSHISAKRVAKSNQSTALERVSFCLGGIMKYTYLGKYYEFGGGGVIMFDAYKKSNGIIVKRNREESPYLKTSSVINYYTNMIESKGYKSMGELT